MNTEQLQSYLGEKFPDELTNLRVVKDILIADAPAGSLRDVVRRLRDDPEVQLDYLRCLSGVDPGEGQLRVVYHFISMEKLHQLGLHVNVPRDRPSVQSLVPLWGTANWQEREIYDLFGIEFEGHPDLRRILLPNEWEGHPLRKDYQFHAEGRGEFVEKQVEVGLLPNPNEQPRERKHSEASDEESEESVPPARDPNRPRKEPRRLGEPRRTE